MAGGAEQPSTLVGLDLQGGSEDDEAFARIAASLAVGAPLPDAAFQAALAAIRLTDRFRTVAGELAPGVKKLIRGLRPGEQRLGAWSRELRARLEEAGYPEARITWTRADGDRTVIITVSAGAGSLVRRVELGGNPEPTPGRSSWPASSWCPGAPCGTRPSRRPPPGT